MVTNNKMWKEGFVALIDILGFSEATLKDNLKGFFSDYDTFIDKIISQYKKEKIGYIVFSDTIVIYSESSAVKSMNSIIEACSLLSTQLLKNGLSTRGCISYGRFHLKMSKNGVIIAGKPIIDAFDYERRQDWIGVMVSPLVIEYLSDCKRLKSFKNNKLIIKCDKIPFHTEDQINSRKYEGYIVIPTIFKTPKPPLNKDIIVRDLREIIRLIEERKSFATGIPSQMKYNNTLEIYENTLYEIQGYGFPNTPAINIILGMDQKIKEKDKWKIPIILVNTEETTAESVNSSIELVHPDSCVSFSCEGFNDDSKWNPGRTIFSNNMKQSLLKDYRLAIGYIIFQLDKGKRMIRLRMSIHAKNMKKHIYWVQLYPSLTDIKMKTIIDEYQ